MIAAEQVRHDLHVAIARMVEARQSKARFERFQQRETGVVTLALNPMPAVVGLHRQHHPVLILGRINATENRRASAVVILVPHNHDRVVPLTPRPGAMYCLHQPLDCAVSLLDQSRVQTDLRAIGESTIVQTVIERAKRIRIFAAMLIIALVGYDEGERRNVPLGKVSILAIRPVKTDDVGQAVPFVIALLHASEVSKRVVFHGIQLDNIRRSKRRKL